MFIRSRSHLAQVLKEKNLEPVTPGEYTRSIHKWHAEWQAQADREDEDVRRMLHSYQHGADAATMHRHADEHPEMDWRPFAKQLGVE
jgi:hypothetical protein